MKSAALLLTAGFLLSLPATAPAATRYVNINNPAPESPYTSWPTAATNIQDTIDMAEAGDDILVTNGVYQTGAREVYGMSNRVAVTTPVTVRSVNGPAATSIVGYGPNGAAAVRCVHLTNGATLAGFTLTNGATQFSGDYEKNQSGGGVWCDSGSNLVSNCVLVGNSACFNGGGAYRGTLSNCALIGNSAKSGAGAWGGWDDRCTLNNCTLTGNTATSDGGGASDATLNNCALAGNSATFGGGAYRGMLNNCTLTGNSASYYAGGAVYGTLNNCTLTGNAASVHGGGVYNSALNNCIIYYNTANSGDNHGDYTALSYCCTTPLPAGGTGNFTNAPLFVDTNGWSNLRLQAGSPCINAGNNAYAVLDPTDLDGNPRIAWGTVDIGAYEFQGAIPATRYVNLDSPAPESPYTSWATAATNIQDAVDGAAAADEVVVTNGVYRGGLTVTNPLTLRSVNGPRFTVVDGGPQYGVRCAYLSDGASLTGFTLTNGRGQYEGGGVWCASTNAFLTNCTLTGNWTDYWGGGVRGGTLYNCILTGNVADSGGGANGSTLHNCTLSGNSASVGGAVVGGTLYNCTLSGNWAGYGGGGAVAGGTLYNCTLTGNWTDYGGGGAIECTLNNCTLTGNTAYYGGGAADRFGGGRCTLNNCTLSGNSAAYYGGGAIECTLNNCIVYFNTCTNGANYSGGSLNYSCTTPMPANGVGNIDTDPLFVDFAGGNLRLQSNSPCINSGNNTSVPAGTDLDGLPRIVGGTVDIGAYECQSPALLDFYLWMQGYGLPTAASAVYADADNDHHNNRQEWMAGTIPTNAASVLRLQTPLVNSPGLLLRWTSDTNRAYFVQRATSLRTPISFTTLRGNIPGQDGVTTYTDTAAPALPAVFYRVGTGSSNGPVSLRLERPELVPGAVTLTWPSVTNRTYYVERATSLSSPAVFSLLKTNIPGLPDFTTFTDTNPPFSTPAYYRVGAAAP